MVDLGSRNPQTVVSTGPCLIRSCRWGFFALVLGTALSCIPGWGDEANNRSNIYTAQGLAENVKTLQRMLPQITADLLSVMKEAEAQEARNFLVRITPAEAAQDVLATVENGHRVVSISLGYIHINCILVDATLTACLLGKLDLLGGYSNAFFFDCVLDEQRAQSGEPRRGPLTFAKYLGLSQEETERLQREEPLYSLRAIALKNCICALIGHEIGHHLLGHSPSMEEPQGKTRGEQLQEEMAADAFAFDLIARLSKADHVYQPALAAMGYTAMMWRGLLNPYTHEDTQQRMSKITEFVLTEIERQSRDDDFQNQVERSGDKDAYSAHIEMFRQYAKSLQPPEAVAEHIPKPERLRFAESGFSIDALEVAPTEALAGPRIVLTMMLPPYDGYAPNVSVQIQPRIGSVKDFLDLTRLQCKALKFSILREEEDGDKLTMEASGPLGSFFVHQYSIAFFADRWVYVCVATSTEQQWPSLGPKLEACLESFRLEPQNPTPQASTVDVPSAPRDEHEVKAKERGQP